MAATILIHPTLLSDAHLAEEVKQRFGIDFTVGPKRIQVERRSAPRRPTSRSSRTPTGGDAA